MTCVDVCICGALCVLALHKPPTQFEGRLDRVLARELLGEAPLRAPSWASCWARATYSGAIRLLQAISRPLYSASEGPIPLRQLPAATLGAWRSFLTSGKSTRLLPKFQPTCPQGVSTAEPRRPALQRAPPPDARSSGGSVYSRVPGARAAWPAGVPWRRRVVPPGESASRDDGRMNAN